MFRKILIANRGEIARRILRTAHRLGVRVVAVYSDADARAPFVEMADEAVHIGPAPAAESYLLADKIIAACKQTGAEAVHPGYGFLSERASFVEALAKENIALGREPREERAPAPFFVGRAAEATGRRLGDARRDEDGTRGDYVDRSC